MKHKKVGLAIMAIILVLSIAFLVADCAITDEPEQTAQKEVEVTPLVITTSDEKVGNITIYADGETVYNYQGPITLQKRDGIYEIRIETFSCSCFEEPPTED